MKGLVLENCELQVTTIVGILML